MPPLMEGRVRLFTSLRDSHFTIQHYLQDWLSTQLPYISKQMIVNRFNEIMNKRFKGGIPTCSDFLWIKNLVVVFLTLFTATLMLFMI